MLFFADLARGKNPASRPVARSELKTRVFPYRKTARVPNPESRVFPYP